MTFAFALSGIHLPFFSCWSTSGQPTLSPWVRPVKVTESPTWIEVVLALTEIEGMVDGLGFGWGLAVMVGDGAGLASVATAPAVPADSRATESAPAARAREIWRWVVCMDVLLSSDGGTRQGLAGSRPAATRAVPGAGGRRLSAR
ncbi:hypothetical protein GCM10011578_012780 [Streptomyces fuscichromogenes]|uniref:Uncharacterized protein n=1 Tax=Streptomyces fuscichromogenes TaxID=1324013 RepID=A0A917X839_9ACTN|nr:hypothetical protein GCM10011578_012780 [Streptomyces fuscichromogenes]